MLKTALKYFSYLILFSLVTNCTKKETTIQKTETSASVDKIAANYYEDYLQLHPLEATAQGDNRFNDLLPISISKEQISK
jgi:hypothetical protein